MDSIYRENDLLEEISALKAELEKLKSDKTASHTPNDVQELFDSTSDLIQITDGDGKFTFVNEAWKYKLGYSEEELANLNVSSVIHPEHLQAFQQSLANCDSITSIETVLLSKHGKSIYVRGKQSLANDTKPLHRCVLYDVSQRARAESAQRLYFKVASLTHRKYQLQALYQEIFTELSGHLQVRNFAIADTTSVDCQFPYRVSEITSSKSVDTVLAEYTAKRGKPMIIYGDGIETILASAGLNSDEITIPTIWLGTPITSDESMLGVMMMYSLNDHTAFNHNDLELLDFIADQVGLAIHRHQSQEKIQDQGARIKAIFESSTHQIWSVDRNLELTSFNHDYQRSFERHFGVRIQPGSNLRSILSSSDQINFNQLHYHYDAAFNGNTESFQISVQNNLGGQTWYEMFFNPIYLPSGKIDEVSAIANDITSQKRAQDALIESEEKFRNIFESFQDIYFRCDLDGKINMISPSVTVVMGYEPKQVIGQNITEYFIANQNINSLIKHLLENNNIRNFEGEAETRYYDKIQFLCNVRLIRTSDGKSQIEGVARDVTQLTKTNKELKHAKDEAEKSLRVKERFLANMSHEIRTPMNGIIGMIDLLSDTILDEEQKDYLQTIQRSSDTLITIVNDILDLSKIEAGKMELRSEPVHLVETIEKVYDLYSQQAANNHTNLFYHIDDNIPDLVISDETRLIQVISNLTSNAIKFSNETGNIHISIVLNEKQGRSYEFKVSVKDAGIGISPKDQEGLFQSFNQLDSSHRKQYGGTGLGLAISKELVKSMNGQIGVASTPGFGSTFWFTFKATLATASDRKKLAQTTNQEAKRFEGETPKVLLVDDNDINRTVASKILSKSGCKVVNASSGFEAIEKITSEKFDLVFMDIQMPEMDGVETTNKIKALALDHLPPVVAMTAYSMQEDREKFIKAGMDDYLAKPIKSNQIIAKVVEWTKFEAKPIGESVQTKTSEPLIINQNTLNQLHKYGGKELIESVLLDFQEEATLQIKTMMQLLPQKDYEGIRSELHTLKGNSGTLGIEKLSNQAAGVEKMIKENKFENLNVELSILNKAFEEFNHNYKNIINDE